MWSFFIILPNLIKETIIKHLAYESLDDELELTLSSQSKNRKYIQNSIVRHYQSCIK
jgi:hypothetical protein